MLREYVVIDDCGLHARPASILVREATKFENDINLVYNSKSLTLKSIMTVMAMGIPHGATFGIEVLGANPESVFEALESVLVEHELI